MKSVISENLQFLRKNAKLSQEELAEKLGVLRQAVAGGTVPDILNCQKLSCLYGVKLDGLVNYSSENEGNNGFPMCLRRCLAIL